MEKKKLINDDDRMGDGMRAVVVIGECDEGWVVVMKKDGCWVVSHRQASGVRGQLVGQVNMHMDDSTGLGLKMGCNGVTNATRQGVVYEVLLACRRPSHRAILSGLQIVRASADYHDITHIKSHTGHHDQIVANMAASFEVQHQMIVRPGYSRSHRGASIASTLRQHAVTVIGARLPQLSDTGAQPGFPFIGKSLTSCTVGSSATGSSRYVGLRHDEQVIPPPLQLRTV
ncbi:hypothetical protein Tco_0806940 [Tanacetum coccineum]